METAEAWELALTTDKTPSVLALSRQNLPTLRCTHTAKNLTAQGGYVLAEGDRQTPRDPDGHRIQRWKSR